MTRYGTVTALIALMILDESYMFKTADQLSKELKVRIDDQMIEQARKRAEAANS